MGIFLFLLPSGRRRGRREEPERGGVDALSRQGRQQTAGLRRPPAARDPVGLPAASLPCPPSCPWTVVQLVSRHLVETVVGGCEEGRPDALLLVSPP